jgi:hypothetical protein
MGRTPAPLEGKGCDTRLPQAHRSGIYAPPALSDFVSISKTY